MDGISSTGGTLLKDRITKKYQELCDAIDCNDTFLALLYSNDIITQGLMSEVKSLHDNTTKAVKILDFLKDCRTDSDVPKVVDILRTSGYSRAADLITEPITLPSATTSHGYQGVVAGYIERQELKQQALQHLTTKPKRDTQITFPVVVLHGFGGNGKSQMARRLVQILTKEVNDSDNNTKCSSVWINAVSETPVIEGFRKFANVSKEENVLGFYKELKDRNLLLVFDDGDDFEMLKKFLPLHDTETNVRVIITAHSEWAAMCDDKNVKNIPVSNFTVNEFREFIAKAVSCIISEKDAKQLEGHTGRIPAILSLVCKGFSQRFKRDPKYTFAKHFAKYGNEIFTFGEDGKLVPGVTASDYKKSAKIVVEQQLLCMDNWKSDGQELMELPKFILNCIAYCIPVWISEDEFFRKHPQILKKADGDYGEIKQAIWILKEFGWVELVGEDDDESDDDDELICSVHACYQIGLQSQLDEQTSEGILDGMIEYIQAGTVVFDEWEKYSHLTAFWPHICSHSKRSSLLNHATETNHCLIVLAEIGLMDEFKSLAGAYQDQGQLVRALLQDDEDSSSIMFGLFGEATNHELVKCFILQIKIYHDHLEDSEKKAWIRHQLLWPIARGIGSEQYENVIFTLDSFDLNVNECLGGRGTLLHRAVAYSNAVRVNNLEVVQLLIEKGVNINEKDDDGQTSLHRAFWNLEIVKVLIENGANLNEKDVNGDTPLQMSIRIEEGAETAKFLIEHGANIYEKNDKGETALLAAVGNLELVKALVEKGADVNEKNIDGATALHKARDLEVIRVLLNSGANIHEKNEGGETALHVSIYLNLEIVQLLIEKGANIHAKDVDGETPLHIAVSRGKAETAKFLIEHGANIYKKNNRGETPLHRACWNLEMVKFLVDSGANIHEKTDKGETVLHLAVNYWSLKVVKLLVEKGGNVNDKTVLGETPLHTAVCQLEKKAWETQREEGDTLEIVKILVEGGANIYEINCEGDTPLQLAFKSNNLDIVDYLINFNQSLLYNGCELSIHKFTILKSIIST